MVSAKDSIEPCDDNYSQTQPSLPPSYSEVFTAPPLDSDSALVLKVSKLDDSGKPFDVQWKHHDDAEGHGGANAHNADGFGILVTALFIIGEMVGGGIISMPNALYRQGWAGIAIICIVSMMSGYTGVQLGRCWIILQERWPELYLKHTQKPYPEMGYQAGGVWMRRVVSLCMNLTLFGTATVFLLIVGRNVNMLVRSWSGTDVSFCYFTLIVAAILLPVTYLGSPKDFWQVSFGAAGSTTIAVIIMIIGMSMQYTSEERKKETIHYPAPTFVNFILGYGTIMFAYSGQSAFPTIQHDMKRPDHFPKAIVRSYSVIFFYYLPVSILGYIVYGSKLDMDNVLPLLPDGWIQQTVTILITLHVMFGFIIFINPINQEFESLFNIPAKFTWKRLVVRTCTVIFIVFLAESIPAMGLLLDLIGGTSMAFLTFVFPGTFYLVLRWRTTTPVSNVDKPIQKWEYPLNALITLVGILGAIASIYAFCYTVASGSNLFKQPCYVNGGN
jgi:vesicular inhibitory amino acid transporter